MTVLTAAAAPRPRTALTAAAAPRPGTAERGGTFAAHRSAVPLLFLIADTGGGHRSSAEAVGQALRRAYPGRFAPVLCDPLGGPRASRLLRLVTGWYGPVVRLAPWAWGAVYHTCDSRPAMGLLRRTVLALAERPAAAAAAACRPAAVVSFHPLTGRAAAAASRWGGAAAPVLTVVTDLVTTHAAWQSQQADRVVVPTPAARGRRGASGVNADRYVATGLPVTSGFWRGPVPPGERAALRRSLGLRDGRFLVVVTGGGEGCGGIARRACAILRRLDDVDVVAICGRNRRLRRRLGGLAARSAGRLRVLGFADNMADWLHCADLVVTKAGPGIIAEAACCGAPLLLTSHLPGQEKGNIGLVTGAGAGLHVPRVRQLATEIGRLRGDRAALNAMRAASARLGRPGAAADVAALLAALADRRSGCRGGGRGAWHERD